MVFSGVARYVSKVFHSLNTIILELFFLFSFFLQFGCYCATQLFFFIKTYREKMSSCPEITGTVLT